MIKITLPKIVLVVDDDPDIRAIVSDAIASHGYTAVPAASGEAALAISRETAIDLAILDVMMPGMSGTEVCGKLKEQPRGEHTPVLMLTARDGLEDKVIAFDRGADDYLTKPFQLKELVARVNALLRVRELTITLLAQHEELRRVQAQLVEKERQLAVVQLAGSAAHNLGQPLSAMLLNCHLLENLSAGDDRFQRALAAIKSDALRMVEMLEKLKQADANSTEQYYAGSAILDLERKT